MGNYHHFWLRVVKATGFLPKGEVVFCIVDTGDEFRVKSSNVYSGVNEFIYENDFRSHFEIYN